MDSRLYRMTPIIKSRNFLEIKIFFIFSGVFYLQTSEITYILYSIYYEVPF